MSPYGCPPNTNPRCNACCSCSPPQITTMSSYRCPPNTNKTQPVSLLHIPIVHWPCLQPNSTEGSKYSVYPCNNKRSTTQYAPHPPSSVPKALGLKIFAVVQTAHSLYSATLWWCVTVCLAWLQFHFTYCSTSGFIQLRACRKYECCGKCELNGKQEIKNHNLITGVNCGI
jgi:hypothetical protein